MKIALIGNMNNNFFSMLRYFHDLEMDATLFLFKNEQAHFFPENDTWEMSKWEKHIIQTDLYNGFTKKNASLLYVSKSKVKKMFEPYDFLIGCGSSPIYIHRAGLKLDLFVPYASGVEYSFLNKNSISKMLGSGISKLLQVRAISKSVLYSVSFEKETINKLKKLKQDILPLGMPMLYNNEKPISHSKYLNDIIDILNKHKLVVFSHVSHIWKNIPKEWRNSYTRNDVLIISFSKYLKHRKTEKPLLVLLEYGPDVIYSKQLIKELNIEEHVLWLKLMSRKEIMVLLNYVDIGAGKLGGLTIWGGVGWEFLSKGVPFFWNLKVTNTEYTELTSNPMPKIFKDTSEFDITNHLLCFEKNPDKYKKIGNDLKIWFEKYGGIGLAKIWRDNILRIYQEKQINETI